MVSFKSFSIHVFVLIALIIFSFSESKGWGFFAHKQINRLAVFSLPKPLFGFYKSNIETITKLAVQADKRRYAVEGEAAYHYIDLDHYFEGDKLLIPRSWDMAVIKYTEDTLLTNGIVPWKIERVYFQLINAFKLNDHSRIIKLSADLGHYVGDAHVPLHCTSNYNGQKTGQYGIHGLWESRIPELFGSTYECLAGRAVFVENINETIWQVVETSNNAVDSVLLFEKMLTEEFDPDKKMTTEPRGNVMVKNYSVMFCESYNRLLAGMVERRFTESIHLLSSLWYSAWVEAGQPDMSGTPANEIPENDSIEYINPVLKNKNLHGHTD